VPDSAKGIDMIYRVYLDLYPIEMTLVLETESLDEARETMALMKQERDTEGCALNVGIYMKETMIDVNGVEQESWTYVI